MERKRVNTASFCSVSWLSLRRFEPPEGHGSPKALLEGLWVQQALLSLKIFELLEASVVGW
jgi:hypothetical protein